MPSSASPASSRTGRCSQSESSVPFAIVPSTIPWSPASGIVSTAPSLQPFVDLLRHADPTIDASAVRNVLLSWGPGKFDAELILDGKAMTPDQKPAAVLIPN